MQIFLIRHAKTLQDEQNLLQNNDAEINPDYLPQLLIAQKQLAVLQISKIYSSPLKRAIQTTKILFPDKDIQILDYIYEFQRPRILNNQPKEVGKDFWEKKFVSEKYNPDWSYDHSESFNDILKRVRKLVLFLQSQKDENIAVIGHGVFFQHVIGEIMFKEKYDPHIFFDLIRPQIQIHNGQILEISNEENMYLYELSNNEGIRKNASHSLIKEKLLINSTSLFSQHTQQNHSQADFQS